MTFDCPHAFWKECIVTERTFSGSGSTNLSSSRPRSSRRQGPSAASAGRTPRHAPVEVEHEFYHSPEPRPRQRAESAGSYAPSQAREVRSHTRPQSTSRAPAWYEKASHVAQHIANLRPKTPNRSTAAVFPMTGVVPGIGCEVRGSKCRGPPMIKDHMGRLHWDCAWSAQHEATRPGVVR